MKVTLLVGLPGCGKTFLGSELAKNGALFIDDISIQGLSPLRQAMYGESDVVVADTFLCRENERKLAASWLKLFGCEIEWVFFENNPEKCLRNVEQRADGRKVEELIGVLTKEYKIPEGVVPRVIYDSTRT